MKKFLQLSRRGITLDFISKQSRFDSLSLVSRQSVLGLVLVLLTLGVGNAWADYYVIDFGSDANVSNGMSSSTTAANTINSGTSYVTSTPYTINSGNCYCGTSSQCIRIGKSGKSSSLSIALSSSGQVSATTIVVNCANTGGSNNSSAKISVNGQTGKTTSSSADDYTFNINDNISSITLSGTASIKIYSITVNYTSAACNDDPSIGAVSLNGSFNLNH